MPQPRRPVPDDFAQVVARLKYVKYVAVHYGAGKTTAERWFREAKIAPAKREVHQRPADFAEQAKVKHAFALGKHYGVAPKVAHRWADEIGIKLINGRVLLPRPRRACPPDFAQMAASLSYNGLRLHYGASRSCVERWAKETGAMPQVFVRKPAEAKPRAGKQARGLYHAIGLSSNIASSKTYTIYDQAADTLRKYGPVNRCDKDGKYQHAGDYWRVGWNVITGDELLERAARYERKRA